MLNPHPPFHLNPIPFQCQHHQQKIKSKKMKLTNVLCAMNEKLILFCINVDMYVCVLNVPYTLKKEEHCVLFVDRLFMMSSKFIKRDTLL